MIMEIINKEDLLLPAKLRYNFLNELKISNDPRDAITLNLEENPDLKYDRTETYWSNKDGIEISDEEFEQLSRYKKNKCTLNFVRVYIDNNGLVVTNELTA